MSRSHQKVQALAARALYEVFQHGMTEDLIGSVETDGIRAEVRVFRIRAVTECERDLLQLLAGQQGPRTTREILSDLDSAGIIHGETTIKKALASLVKRRLIQVNGKKGGYLITELGEDVIRS